MPLGIGIGISPTLGQGAAASTTPSYILLAGGASFLLLANGSSKLKKAS